MLTSLRIENFAIVSQLELDFKSGMTAFTGETGAGKSIMIDALMLALGWRADISVIRPGAEKCEIHACFQIDLHSSPAQWLQEHDLEVQDEIWLRRILYMEGRSKSYINGQPFPLQKVKELSELLVDIHGQHQYQTLLQAHTHRQQLDQFAENHDLLLSVKQLYEQYQQLQIAVNSFQLPEQAERLSLLQYQLEELTSLGVQEGEMQALHTEHQLLHHAVDYLKAADAIHEVLASDDEPNVCQGLNQALQWLSSLPQEQTHVRSAYHLLNNTLIQCEEAVDEMAKFAQHVQLDPERLQEVEARISQLHQVARKYHIETSQLPNFIVLQQMELEKLQENEKKQAALQLQLEQAKHAYDEAAFALRASRQQHAPKLADDISQTIRQLGMPNGYITVEITPVEKMHVHGLDKIEYKVCTNPGMAPDSLAKIASGGELSRISLAIHMITAQRGATPTLLFDEVDVGIGGATAALVGQLLRQLGERLQLFCVTHQAQVASSAHHHFVVEKYTEGQQTFSRIIPLRETDKIDEIARMLGGLTITEQTRSHAQEMLLNAAV